MYNHNARPIADIGSPQLQDDSVEEADKWGVPGSLTKKFGVNYSKFSNRISSQGLNTFHVKPRRMIDCLGGKRSQFKAAIAIAGSNDMSYKVERHEL